jgi:hypothetical protein
MSVYGTLPALTADQTARMRQLAPDFDTLIARIIQGGFVTRYIIPAANMQAAGAALVHAAITQPAADTTTVTTAITNPLAPRALSITGNQATCAGNVVIVGTDINDKAITETIVLNGAALVAGVQAFKTITSITVPVRGAGGDTVTVGWGDLLGLPVCLKRATVDYITVDGVKEAAAAVTIDPDETSKNTVDPTTALAAQEIGIYFRVEID